MVTVRKMYWVQTRPAMSNDFEDSCGYKNHSQEGPNGLLRHKIGHGCIGHGAGTYDYITGDFS